MNWRGERLLRLILAIGLALGLPGGAARASVPQPHVTIEEAAPDVTPDDREAVVAMLRREYVRVASYLGVADGPAVRVRIVERYRGMEVRVATAYPERGLILIPPSIARRGLIPGAHELTHLIAGRGASQTLTEGLAVYIHDKFGEQPAFPTFRTDLRSGLRQALARLDLAAHPTLDEIEGWIGDFDRQSHRRYAYLAAGAFVGFLIEDIFRGDLRRFMDFYRTGDLAAASGLAPGRAERRFRDSSWLAPG